MAAPAQPILASTLYTAHLGNSDYNATWKSRKGRRLLTGCRSIDVMLKGGLGHEDAEGMLCCVSDSATGAGGTEVSENTVT